LHFDTLRFARRPGSEYHVREVLRPHTDVERTCRTVGNINGRGIESNHARRRAVGDVLETGLRDEKTDACIAEYISQALWWMRWIHRYVGTASFENGPERYRYDHRTLKADSDQCAATNSRPEQVVGESVGPLVERVVA
jgi:hypothetical protein